MDLLQRQPELRLPKLVVSEAGASVYSASRSGDPGISRLGCFAARGGIHRPTLAGSAGGTGQDRSQESSVSANTSTMSIRGATGPVAGCCCRRLCERGRGRCEYGIGAAAGPSRRSQPLAWRENDGRLPRRQWRLPHRRNVTTGSTSGPKPSNRQPVSCASPAATSTGSLRCAPGGLPGGGAYSPGQHRSCGAGNGALLKSVNPHVSSMNGLVCRR